MFVCRISLILFLLTSGSLCEEQDETKEEITPVEKEKGLVTPLKEEKGPTLFYDGKLFLMQLRSPIQASVFEQDQKGPIAVIDLDEPAKSVKGSMVDTNKTNFKVNIDWKSQSFGSSIKNLQHSGKNCKENDLIGVDDKALVFQVNMIFSKRSDMYRLSEMEVTRLTVGGQQITSNQLQVYTSHRYGVEAPIGLAFCCVNSGMFRPKPNSNRYSVGLTLPDMVLQVFDLENKTNFGPYWECGEMLPIPLLVGLIITLFFALICYYGFSMLANINTMDRFDDPKGPAIHVPLTE